MNIPVCSEPPSSWVQTEVFGHLVNSCEFVRTGAHPAFNEAFWLLVAALYLNM